MVAQRDLQSDVLLGGTATVWSWSTGCLRGNSWETRHAIAIMGTAKVTAETRKEICKILAWDLTQLERGIYDALDYAGHFHALGSSREKLGEQRMPLKAVIWQNY